MSIFTGLAALIAASMFARVALADPPIRQSEERQQKVEEVTVFVTGSLIPRRVKLRRVGTKTTSPVRIIDRTEIDQNGRPTTPGALINDPSVQVIGR